MAAAAAAADIFRAYADSYATLLASFMPYAAAFERKRCMLRQRR